jgi:hypothetical protein
MVAELSDRSLGEGFSAERAAVEGLDGLAQASLAEPKAVTPTEAQLAQDAVSAIDSLIQRLREEARSPAQFHARALPIIAELGRALDESAAQARSQRGLDSAGSRPVQSSSAPTPKGTPSARSERQPDAPDSSPPVPRAAVLGTPAGGAQTAPKDAQAAAAASEAPDQVLRLLHQIVQAPEEDHLVRGAVFLALSTRLGVADFRAHFDDWISPGEVHPPELVRSAAIAAALRGAESPCPQALRLERVLSLPGNEDSGLPAIYPLELRRTVDAYCLAGIEAWLKASDGRREALEQAPLQGPEGMAQDAPTQEPEGEYSRAELLDYWSALALLYALWGHAGLEDAEIVQRLVKDAKPSVLRFSAKDVITLLPAVFLAQSLGPCSERLAKLVRALENSQNDLYKSVAEAYAGCGQDPLRIEKLAKLEELRLSDEPFADALALSLLIEWRHVAPRFSLASPQDQDAALRILAQAAGDPEAEETARMMAWECIDRTESTEILTAARLVCGPDMPDLLFGRLMTRLDQFSADESLRASLVEHLVWMRGLGMNSQRAAAIEALLASLEQSNE